jgi:hypothetical protein
MRTDQAWEAGPLQFAGGGTQGKSQFIAELHHFSALSQGRILSSVQI